MKVLTIHLTTFSFTWVLSLGGLWDEFWTTCRAYIGGTVTFYYFGRHGHGPQSECFVFFRVGKVALKCLFSWYPVLLTECVTMRPIEMKSTPPSVANESPAFFGEFIRLASVPNRPFNIDYGVFFHRLIRPSLSSDNVVLLPPTSSTSWTSSKFRVSISNLKQLSFILRWDKIWFARLRHESLLQNQPLISFSFTIHHRAQNEWFEAPPIWRPLFHQSKIGSGLPGVHQF